MAETFRQASVAEPNGEKIPDSDMPSSRLQLEGQNISPETLAFRQAHQVHIDAGERRNTQILQASSKPTSPRA